MTKDSKEIVNIMGVYIALNIGAGFASGQEILQFFSGFGWWGFLTGLITFIFMLYSGESLIDAGWQSRNNQKISVYEYFGGSVIGVAYNIIIPILLYGSYIVMVAGAGSVLDQFFQISNIIGRIIVSVIAVGSLFFNFQYIAKFISKLGKGIAFIIFLVSLLVIFKGLSHIPQVSSFVQQFPIDTGSDTFYGAGALYAGSIILASSQFLFDLGMHLKKRSSGVYGILFGAMGFVGVALIIHSAILLYYDKVYTLPIVTIYFAELLSPFVAFVVTLLLFIAMCSASVVSLWSVSNIIRKKLFRWNKRYFAVVIILGIVGLFLSAIPFSTLVNIIYPINGSFGLCLTGLIIYKNRKLAYHQDNPQEQQH